MVLAKRCQPLLAKPVAFPWQQSKHCQNPPVQSSLLFLIYQPTSLFVAHAFGHLFSVLFFIVYAQTIQCIVHVAQCPFRYASRYMHTFRHCDTAETGDVIRYQALKEAINGHAQNVHPACVWWLFYLAWQGSSECTSCPCKNKSLLCLLLCRPLPFSLPLSSQSLKSVLFRVMFLNCTFIFGQF